MEMICEQALFFVDVQTTTPALFLEYESWWLVALEFKTFKSNATGKK
jgi:hypothetical protein